MSRRPPSGHHRPMPAPPGVPTGCLRGARGEESRTTGQGVPGRVRVPGGHGGAPVKPRVGDAGTLAWGSATPSHAHGGMRNAPVARGEGSAWVRRMLKHRGC